MKIKSKKKHSLKRKILFCLTMFFIGIYISFNYLEKHKVNIDNKYNNFLLDEVFSNKTIPNRFSSLYEKNEQKKLEKQPLVYLYNTHDTEGYASNNLFAFKPNVTMLKYILKEKLEANDIIVLTEDRSIKELLNRNGWSYSRSYQASRVYLDEAKANYPTIKYFIDLHRDSLKKDRTTVTINDKSYAKILFLIGLENPSYNSNLEFTNKINNKINEKYPNLSKGILKKGGPGVNGVYNQDISPNSILVEFGGVDNTTYEVLNSLIAFSDCFVEVINES